MNVVDNYELTPVTALFCHYDNNGEFAFLDIDNAEVLKIVLAAGADVNKPGASAQTPLMLACEFGEPESACILLDHGANPNPKSVLAGGTTPLMLAKRDGDTAMVMLLKAHGARR